MNLRATLLNVAWLAAASGCGGTAVTQSSADAGHPSPDGATPDGTTPDGTTPDGAIPAEACGGCNCGSPAVPNGNATPAEACAIAGEMRDLGSEACSDFCDKLNPGGGSEYACTVADSYLKAYESALDGGARADSGAELDGGPDGGARVCPVWSGSVVVSCGYVCLGRRTSGAAEPPACPDEDLGAVFANRAYLEAVSVHAFARLERELRAHGAPSSLVGAARRARRDEVRHTAMTARLAERYGGSFRRPYVADAPHVRSLFELAVENAVEGCVRETYGAVVGLVEAGGSRDAVVRAASRAISEDECRHAELAFAIAAWLGPRLTPEEREATGAATQAAIADLAQGGDARLVALLEEHVWRASLRLTLEPVRA